MANVFLAWQNRADEGTLSGGSWQPTLPLSNLQNRQVQKLGRTTDTSPGSTQFVLDLGQPRAIGVLALVVHNLSVTAKVRIVASDSKNALTNLLPSGSPLALASWTLSQASVASNASTGLSGSMTADKLIATSSVGQHGGAVTVSKTAAPITYTYTVCAKPAGLNCFVIGLDDGGSNGCQAIVNAATGIVLTGPTLYGSGWSAPRITVTAGADGWCKATLTVTANSASAVRAAVGCAQDNGNQSFAGNGVDGVLFDAIELSDGLSYYDSGWSAVWPAGMIPQSLLEWEDDNFWLGTLSQSARAGYQSPYIHLLPTTLNMRFWRVEIDDSGNPDGCVQIGRLFIAKGWRPGTNYSYGAELGYEDPSPVETSLSGAEFFDVRSRYRVFRFGLDYVSESDAYSQAMDLQRVSGISGEVLLIADSDDAPRMPMRAFVGRLRQIGAVSQPNPSSYSTKFEIKELL